MPTEETVKILPDLTEEQQKQVAEALGRREEADYRAFLLMRRFLPYVHVPEDEEEEVKDMLKEADEIIDDREKANDDFMRALGLMR